MVSATIQYLFSANQFIAVRLHSMRKIKDSPFYSPSQSMKSPQQFIKLQAPEILSSDSSQKI
jgi:hypothetical protein